MTREMELCDLCGACTLWIKINDHSEDYKWLIRLLEPYSVEEFLLLLLVMLLRNLGIIRYKKLALLAYLI